MFYKRIVSKTLVCLLTVALAATSCSTAQMQQMKEEQNKKLQTKYTSFDVCFRDEKVVAMVGMGIIGGVVGKLLGGKGARGDKAAGIGVGIGTILGYKIAWGNCLEAFSVKPKNVMVNDRATLLAQGEQKSAQTNVKSLYIQTISASPFVFGKDLEIAVTYTYLSDNPAAQDIKAKVSRNIIFTAPDGSKQDIGAPTEDTIQQGLNKSIFAIPTPSPEDAPEFQSVTDWAFKFVIEVDGMRQEKILPLSKLNSSRVSVEAKKPSNEMIQTPGVTTHQNDKINLRKGTKLFAKPNSSSVLTRLSKGSSVTVLQRTIVGGSKWVEVRTPDGVDGWIKDNSK